MLGVSESNKISDQKAYAFVTAYAVRLYTDKRDA